MWVGWARLLSFLQYIAVNIASDIVHTCNADMFSVFKLCTCVMNERTTYSVRTYMYGAICSTYMQSVYMCNEYALAGLTRYCSKAYYVAQLVAWCD